MPILIRSQKLIMEVIYYNLIKSLSTRYSATYAASNPNFRVTDRIPNSAPQHREQYLPAALYERAVVRLPEL
jgi:hypothetical protein